MGPEFLSLPFTEFCLSASSNMNDSAPRGLLLSTVSSITLFHKLSGLRFTAVTMEYSLEERCAALEILDKYRLRIIQSAGSNCARREVYKLAIMGEKFDRNV
jgi:hypothetical protein